VFLVEASVKVTFKLPAHAHSKLEMWLEKRKFYYLHSYIKPTNND